MKHRFLATLLVLTTVGALGFLIYLNIPRFNLKKSQTSVIQQPIVEYPKEECNTEHEVEFAHYDGTDPLWKNNNKFGLYIYAENKDYFNIADELVNSKGGDWGYVLIPYNVKDTDYTKWNNAFEKMRSKHLIPIIQLWDVDTDDYEEQTHKAAEFLDGFIWPIKYRYISVYNEPNDAKF